METNDIDTQESLNPVEDQTSINNDELEGLDEEVQKKVKTLDAQRKSWRDKAVDPESGKTYKELLETQKAQKTEDKTSQNDETKKPDDKYMERLDKMALKVAGIKEAEEVELFNKWKEQTGREADDIVGNEIFNKELQELRTEKANLAATSEVEGGTDTSGAKNTADYWIAKAVKGDDGKLRFPEETPKELYSKILDKLSECEPSTSEELKFYNS